MRWLPVVVVLLASGAVAAKTPPPAPPAKPRPSTSVWEPLVQPSVRYRLFSEQDRDRFVELETYDVRVVKDARVARLRWSHVNGDARSPLGNSLPSQVAVTKRGVWWLTDRADDKQVAEALRRKPDLADPPRPRTDDEGYVRQDGDVVCMGVGLPPGTGKCEVEPCHAEVCFAAGRGPVSLSGNYAPGGLTFTAPAVDPGGKMVGVPECDRFLARMDRCASHGHIPPGMRKQLSTQRDEWARQFRTMARDAGARDAAMMCEAAAEAMQETMITWNCP
jgi:hypothetical protein